MQRYLLTLLLCLSCLQQAAAQRSISVLGDSYSTFEGFMSCDSNLVWYFPENALHPSAVRDSRNGNDVKDVRQTWWHLLCTQHGYRLCANNSFSGATVCWTGYRDRQTGLPGDFQNRSFENRARYLGCNPDIILVCGATNDSWCGAPIGEYKYEDWTADDLRTFRPALAKMFVNLSLYYPNVPVVFILNSELKPSVNESVETICQHYSIPLVRLHDIDKQGGHPSVKGMAAMAEQVAAVLSTLPKE